MRYKKQDGRVVEEFWPQDLAGDPDSPNQIAPLVKALRLRKALEKAGATPEVVKALMDIWMGKALTNSTPLPIAEVFMVVPISLTEEEKEVFVELRKRLLGF